MILFLGGLALLLVGYFTYGRLVERIVGPGPVIGTFALVFAAYALRRTRS